MSNQIFAKQIDTNKQKLTIPIGYINEIQNCSQPKS